MLVMPTPRRLVRSHSSSTVAPTLSGRSVSRGMDKTDSENDDFADGFDIDEWEITLQFPIPGARRPRTATPLPDSPHEDDGLGSDFGDNKVFEDLERAATPTPFNRGCDALPIEFEDVFEEDGQDAFEDNIEHAFDENSRSANPTPYSRRNRTRVENPMEGLLAGAVKVNQTRKSKVIQNLKPLHPTQYLCTLPKCALPKWIKLLCSDNTVVRVRSAAFGAAGPTTAHLLNKIIESLPTGIDSAADIPLLKMDQEPDVIQLFAVMLRGSGSIHFSDVVQCMPGEVPAVVNRVTRLLKFLQDMSCIKLRNMVLWQLRNRPPVRLGQGCRIPVAVGQFILGAALDERVICLSALHGSLALGKGKPVSTPNDLSALKHIGGLGKLIPPNYRAALDSVLDSRGCAITVDWDKAENLFGDGYRCWSDSIAGDAKRRAAAPNIHHATDRLSRLTPLTGHGRIQSVVGRA
ncbi:hypothetical protein CspeluHIS016_0502930 [Cutaneotrichosporon spelunceum]|uniref:Uncharacterized protein n=1 Tax=Cutaneotrichosporon spelunceum TaxID=1672016 RepID=A0AAD3TXA7_9TREE|nr:hypothetical protein CspeluHIS016_0502930 [Cutaneotrichosporon spelunceum]